MAPQKHTSKKGKASGFVVGSARFKKISAVEGIKFTPEMKGRTALSERKDVTAEERRKTIIREYFLK
jgi:hypothetical protein